MNKKTFAVTILLMLLAALSLTGCTESDPYKEWKKQPNRQIVFMSKTDSPQGELYLLDKEGQITRLTNNDRHENNPALSPDGKKVAFHGGDINDPLSWDIYIRDLETGQETRLTDNSVIDGHPDWSPDGSKLVFGSFRTAGGAPSGAADIYMVNTDGFGLTRLTDSEWEDNDPEWSPDGSKIVFKSTRNTRQSAREEIFVMNSDGTNVKQLTTTSGWESDHDPSWSPDSSNIVFYRFHGSRPWTDITNLTVFQNQWQQLTPWNCYRVGLNGNAMRLTDARYASTYPVYSVNGSAILTLRLDFVFIDNKLKGIEHRLILMEPDGSGQVQLIPDTDHRYTMEYYDW